MAVHRTVRSTHEEGKTEACLLRVVNKSSRLVKVVWVGFDGREVSYLELESGHARPQQTYTTHVWRLRLADTNALVGEYSGPSAVLEVQPDGSLRTHPWSGTAPEPKPEWGDYAKRGEALGIEIWSYACVDVRAIRIAEHIIRRMLEASPTDVIQRLVEGGAKVAIIGRNQVTTDIPEHTFMRWSEGGRDTDTTTRGLGGTQESPTTSCGEENLLMEDDRFYGSENILVHEFGHAVMNIGLTPEDRSIIKQLYNQAYRSGMYNKDAYIMENEDEYWAEGTQAWFDATVRMSVTSGVNTREKLQARDPGLADMMVRAYGHGTWRYPHDSPSPFPSITREGSQSGESANAANTVAAASAPLGEGRSRTNGSAGRVAVTLSAPGVEDTMERVRLAATSGGSQLSWLSGLEAACLPAGTSVCGGGALPSMSPGGSAVGCGAALWAVVRGAVVGHPAHSAVKLS